MKSVRLGDELEAKLDRAARALAMSQSEFLRDALARRCAEVLGGSLEERLAPVIGIVKSGGGPCCQIRGGFPGNPGPETPAMILTDAGPLIAILDRGESGHQACIDCLKELTGPMLTTWPAFTEAMYLLGEAGGWRAQAALWSLEDKGDVEIAEQRPEDRRRMQALMEKYQDRLMDLADASLVVLAEKRSLRDIFTLDHADFQVYRLHGRQTFRLWPRRI